ncbi:hypothetical protein [Marinimicrococcus flavescens]|uniref:Macro domain-containing protein n=1 Tax=Marinimicrococcus flavescens TaxID=3031815 RepID=A0AAP3XQE2_9PROT|nr:hypothetical protein [Marinimicrococcus flavescens]
MDWFEKLTGFRERDYDEARSRLEVAGERLVSKVNGASYRTGRLELLSLGDLRARGRAALAEGRLKVGQVVGDVRRMHREPANAGALFQVASQFNLLEMTGPSITPEHGVTRYQGDPTQGPACAIAAGAATIYRNYFVPLGGGAGQRADRQIDALADLGGRLAADLGVEPRSLWAMRNGYALPSAAGLGRITGHLRELDDAARDRLRERLSIGLHWDVEATEASGPQRPIVSQAFCSAMPVSYSGMGSREWDPLGPLVLEAAYEATLWAAVLNAQRGSSPVVYLTLLGGGAFGNPDGWIHAAIRRALRLLGNTGLDVRLVSYRQPSPATERLVREFAGPLQEQARA